MSAKNPTNPHDNEHLQGNALLSRLRDGWSPLPAKTVFALVMAGLRVRLTRSLVTMLAVVLAIAFFAYTGLTNKLTENLALLAADLAGSPGVPTAEINRALNELVSLDPAKADLPPAQEWIPLLIVESPDDIRAARDAAAAPPADAMAVERLQRQLDLLLWARGDQSRISSENFRTIADAFLRERAQRFIPTFYNPGAWDATAERQAQFFLNFFRSHPDHTNAVSIIEDVIAVEDRRALASRLTQSLRDAGVNIESTLAGETADLWIIIMALLLCTVGIANAMLMSVTERFREIGTMKCLGAQDGLVVNLFLLESGFLGISGAVLGTILGIFIALAGGFLQFRGFVIDAFPILDALPVLGGAFLIGIVLAVLGTLYPAVLAARMKPVDALRIDE